jgi:hypothetical protein
MGGMKEDARPYQDHIIANPRILAGKPVVRGTRIRRGFGSEGARRESGH